jgi:hypothetical protein
MVISRAAQKQRAKYIHMAGRAGNEYQWNSAYETTIKAHEIIRVL